jgi:hypothetical protein
VHIESIARQELGKGHPHVLKTGVAQASD